MSTPALRDFFYPHDPDTVIHAVRENRRLFLRTDRADALARLLPWATLNTIVSVEGLVSNQIRATRRGRDMPVEMISTIQRGRHHRFLSPTALHDLCHQGVSLVVNSIDRQVPAIAAMTAMIERYLRCETIANAYISFQADSAFKPHYDNQNVLILQLHGRKRWWCYGQIDRFPTESRAFPHQDAMPAAEWEGVLEPGDMLFLPRGDAHRAEVEGEQSVHLTVTMVPANGEDLIRWLGRRALAHELARQDVPAFGDRTATADQTDAYKRLLHELVDALDVDAFLTDVDHWRAPLRPLNLGIEGALAPNMVVWLALRRRVPLPMVPTGEDIMASFGDIKVRLNAHERDMLALLLEQDRLTIAELAVSLPDLDAAATVAALARKSLVYLFEAP